MEIMFGDLAVNLHVEWKLWPLFHKDDVEFRVSRFRRGIRVTNSHGDVIAVIRLRPDGYFLRRLLVGNRRVLGGVLLGDWVRHYGERHVVILKSGEWLNISAYAYELAGDCIVYYYAVNGNSVEDKRVISKDSVLVVVDVKHGVPIVVGVDGS